MKRLLPILLLVTLLLALTPVIVHASPLIQEGDGGESDAIGNVIGTLGLYAAMMAVLAVGTEVVIDMVRPLFGLKRKTTATEALDSLKEWLPGTMEELGVSPQAQQQLNEQIKKMRDVTTQFGDSMERAEAQIKEHLHDFLKDLAIHGVQHVIDEHWPGPSGLEARLKAIDPKLDTAQVRNWLEDTLTQLKDSNVAELASYTQSVTNLLDSVRKQRNELQSPLRKLWRRLRDVLNKWAVKLEEFARTKWPNRQWVPYVISVPLRLPAYLEYIWAWLRDELPDGSTFLKRLENLGAYKPFAPLLSLEDAAKCILEEDMVHKDEGNRRIRWLRIISAVVGVALAFSLQVDSLRLLEPILDDTANVFRLAPTEEPSETIDWWSIEVVIERSDGDPDNDNFHPRLGLPWKFGDAVAWLLTNLTPGIILSGLGAAAGSGFWHDQLDKLRSAKEVSGQVQELAGQVKSLTG